MGREEHKAPAVSQLVEADQEVRSVGGADAEVGVVVSPPLIEDFDHLVHRAGEANPLGDDPVHFVRTALHAEMLHRQEPTFRLRATHDGVER